MKIMFRMLKEDKIMVAHGRGSLYYAESEQRKRKVGVAESGKFSCDSCDSCVLFSLGVIIDMLKKNYYIHQKGIKDMK